jgi:hypothetical protein
MPNIEPTNNSNLSTGKQKVLVFEDVLQLAQAYDDNEWSLDKEIELLVEMATGSDKDTVRLGAIKAIQAHRHIILKNCGLISPPSKDAPVSAEEDQSLAADTVLELLNTNRKEEHGKTNTGGPDSQPEKNDCVVTAESDAGDDRNSGPEKTGESGEAGEDNGTDRDSTGGSQPDSGGLTDALCSRPGKQHFEGFAARRHREIHKPESE